MDGEHVSLSNPESWIKGYELRELIGEGGFARVYHAYQPSVNRDVALKLILPALANLPEFIRNFESEARLVARLEHPYIVPLYDYWRQPEGAYLVMRWLRGGTMRDLLRSRGALELRFTAHMLAQIASALTLAHRSSIVHRDLKPENILLDEAGNTYLADFGIARTVTDAPDETVQTGSPAYASPEQIMNRAITQQTDIYSLGLIVYEALAGAHPFLTEGDSYTTLLTRQTRQALPPLKVPSLSDLNPQLPGELMRVLKRATAKDPADRYPDALSFAAQFNEVVAPYVQDETLAITPFSDALIVPNPYRGLRAFEEGDAGNFFGRESLSQHLITRLTADAPYRRFLAVVGPSGSGKSSVVKAGLIPALKQDPRWFVVEMTPGTTPVENLLAELTQIAPRPLSALHGANGSSPHAALLPHAVAEVVPEILPNGGDLLLVIDQFEEVFAPACQQREPFLASLNAMTTDPDSRVQIVITLRADFYDHPLRSATLGPMIRSRTEVVIPLTADEIERAIVEPARRVGVRVEGGLVSVLIKEISQQPGALPLLQYALTELFDRRKGAVLRLEDYYARGGVFGMLARRADEVYAQHPPDSQRGIRQIFLRLVTLGEGTEDTRRRARLTELTSMMPETPQLVRDILEAFVKSRLLTFDNDPETREPTVEIAHEALIREWEMLRGWLTANRDQLRVQNQLAAAAALWQRQDRDASYLARGARLEQFSALQNITLSDHERAFLRASAALERRATRRTVLVIAALVVLLVAVSMFAVLAVSERSTALYERDRANLESRVSRSREIAAIANDQPTDRALLLSMAAYRTSPTFEARTSLLRALQADQRLIRYLHGHSDAVRAVEHHGAWWASGGADGRVILWDKTTLEPRALGQHDREVNALAFSPDGSQLASAAADGTVWIWSLEDGSHTPLGEDGTAHPKNVWALAYNAQSTLLASGDEDGLLRLWTVASGEAYTTQAHQDGLYAAAFTPNGSALLTGGGDNRIRRWQVVPGRASGAAGLEETAVYEGHGNWVWRLVFDGEDLLSADSDGLIMRWREGEPVQRLRQDVWVRDLRVSANRRFLITGGTDGAVRVLQASDGQLVTRLAQPASVWSVALDGQTVLAASTALTVWDLGGTSGLSESIGQQTEAVLALAVLEDRIAAAGSNIPGGTSFDLYLWPRAAGTGEPARLAGHQTFVTSLAHDPDSGLLASASTDGQVLLWQDGEQVGGFLTGDTIFSLAFGTRSGQTVLAVGGSGSATLWDVTRRTRIGEPLALHGDRITALAYRNGIWASSSLDGTIALFDADGIRHRLEGHTDGVLSVDISADGRLVASASRDETVRLWTSDGIPVGEPLTGHGQRVLAVAFSPDGTLLASSGTDARVMLWDVETGLLLGAPLTGHTDWVNVLKFTPDGQELVSGARDGVIKRWSVSLDAWAQRACSIANRDLRPDEWQRFLHQAPAFTLCAAQQPALGSASGASP